MTESKDVFNPEHVDELRVEIENKFLEFMQNSEKTTNKAGAGRARKNSLELTKMLKAYRAISIKSDTKRK